MKGLYIIPKTGSLFIVRPTDMQVIGNCRTKFAVPSIGSIIHVGSLVSVGIILFADDSSSPINLKLLHYNYVTFSSDSNTLIYDSLLNALSLWFSCNLLDFPMYK